MIGWLTGRFSAPLLAKVGIGLAVALALSMAALGLTARAYVAAKAEVAAEIERCNTRTAESVAAAERIARQAAQEAADARIAAAEAALARSEAAHAAEKRSREQAESAAQAREAELIAIAEEAFDANEIPDSNACLNAFIPSRVLRCVLNQGEAGSGPGIGGGGGGSLCADPAGLDGVHTGFSNVTFLEGLLFWGGDRGAAIRWNERGSEIRRIEGEVIDGDSE